MLRPYGTRFLPLLLGFTLLALVMPAHARAIVIAGKKKVQSKEKSVSGNANILGRNLATIDPDTKVGLNLVYAMQYDEAIAAFQAAVDRYPNDPFAINHLMQAVLLKELFRLNALDTTLYADNGFLTGKALPADPQVRARLMKMADTAQGLCDQRLKTNPNDVEALYARGVTRGLRLTYIALVEKSFFSALKNAIASRNDHERVLELDPSYTDAKLVVGVHNYIVGSMPLAARMMAGIIGVHGDKKKGIALLQEVGESHAETSADARAALALFLRREARYDDGLKVMQTLTAQFPRNFIFALEQANLLKDAGHGKAAIQQYQSVVARAQASEFPAAHIERAYYGLAEALKGQHLPTEALDAYNACLEQKGATPDLRLRALLGAGQMLDALDRRETALKQYHEVVVLEPDSEQAAQARGYIKQAFRYPT